MDYEATLTRKLKLLFPDEMRMAEVISILDSYGKETHEQEIIRVKLAILKLCKSDLEQIKITTNLAKQDYRDILAWAEYPRQSLKLPMSDGLKKEKFIDADKIDYEKWLNS